jgi:hypothetical protein
MWRFNTAQFSSVFSKSFHYLTCLSSIFSISFHNSTWVSSVFFISFHFSTSEKMGKIWKKSKLNGEKIWKI